MKAKTSEALKYRCGAVAILAAAALACTLAMGGCTTAKPANIDENDLVDADQMAASLSEPMDEVDATIYSAENMTAQDEASASTPTAAEGADEPTEVNPSSNSADSNASIKSNDAGSANITAQDEASASTPTAAEGANEPTEVNND